MRPGVRHSRFSGVVDGSEDVTFGSGGGSNSGVLPVAEGTDARIDGVGPGGGVRLGYSITSTRPLGPTRTTRPAAGVGRGD